MLPIVTELIAACVDGQGVVSLSLYTVNHKNVNLISDLNFG